MRIAIADDGALFRDGLRLLLEAAGHEVVHVVGGGDDLVDRVRADPVDVAVLDVRMPPEPEGGLVAAGRLRASHPSVGLLLLSHDAEIHHLGRMLEIGPGAIGYRLKDQVSSITALNDTLARIAAGEIVVEPALISKLVAYARQQRGELRTLTSSEIRVLRLIAAGLSDAGIADELGVSLKAAETHVGAVLAKLTIPDTADDSRVLAVLRYIDSSRSRDIAGPAGEV